jgi:hypothetical protein
MQSPIAFVATLFIGAACCLGLGVMGAAEWLEWSRGGVHGQMVGDDPRIPIEARTGAPGSVRVNVKYLTDAGEVPAPGVWVSPDVLARLAAGDAVPAYFLRDEPRRVLLDGREPDNPWWFLGIGLVLLPTALYARRLLLRETAAKARR